MSLNEVFFLSFSFRLTYQQIIFKYTSLKLKFKTTIGLPRSHNVPGSAVHGKETFRVVAKGIGHFPVLPLVRVRGQHPHNGLALRHVFRQRRCVNGFAEPWAVVVLVQNGHDDLSGARTPGRARVGARHDQVVNSLTFAIQ